MSKEFIRVATLSDIPRGKMKCAIAQGRRILLANVDGDVLAADDACTHEDAPLCTGSLHGEWVKCPLHGSKFNLRTGAVMDEPAEIPLAIHAVEVRGQDIFVKLSNSETL